MSFINLGRTTKTNITFYREDGLGRDGYITYNNAGFWKDKQILSKEQYPHKKFEIFYSLIHQPAPFQYYSDGSGRDTYVLKNTSGLIKHFEPLAQQKLEKYLRVGNEKHIFKTKIFLNKTQRKYLNKLKRIQDKVIKRLYNDSLEKLKKNNFQCRTNSYNDLINNEKLEPMNSIITPKNMSMSINYINSQQNQSRNLKELKQKFKGKLTNLKSNTYRNKNIFQKFFENSSKNNTNKRVKILKNLRINSPGLKHDFIPNEINNNYNDTNNSNNTNNINEYNNLNNISSNLTTKENLMLDYRNNIKSFHRYNNPFNFNNKTFGFPFSTIHRNKASKEQKFNFSLRKKNDIKKFILSNRNFDDNKINNTNF